MILEPPKVFEKERKTEIAAEAQHWDYLPLTKQNFQIFLPVNNHMQTNCNFCYFFKNFV